MIIIGERWYLILNLECYWFLDFYGDWYVYRDVFVSVKILWNVRKKVWNLYSCVKIYEI